MGWKIKSPLLVISRVGEGIFIKLRTLNVVFKNADFVLIFVKSMSKLV